jgi:hypothetical protein
MAQKSARMAQKSEIKTETAKSGKLVDRADGEKKLKSRLKLRNLEIW